MSDSEPPFFHHQVDARMIPEPKGPDQSGSESAGPELAGPQQTAVAPSAYQAPGPTGGPIVQAKVAEPVSTSPQLSVAGKVIVTICWLMVTGFVVFSLLTPYVSRSADVEVANRKLAMTDQIEPIYFIGVGALGPGFDSPQLESMVETSARSGGGTFNQRLARAIMLGEVKGYEAALEHLGVIDEAAEKASYEPTAEELQNREILDRLFTEYMAENWQAASVDEASRTALKEQLGWVGALALSPKEGESAEREKLEGKASMFAMTMLGGAFAGFMAFGLGLFLAMLTVVLLLMGKLRSALIPQTGHGGIYMETFVIWLIVFILISFLIALVAPAEAQLPANIVGFPASLLALLWPVIRGVKWRDVCADIGITTRRLWLEPFCGLVGYIAGLPLLGAAALFMVITLALFGEQPDPNGFEPVYAPSHPINDTVEAGGGWTFLFVALTAVIMAPLVEETIFRGVLYRHLRDMTAPTRVLVSTILSAGISGFVFAAIHPQGIFVVPVLGTLGFLFALVREWRGSLVAPMTMHAIHNGMITMMLLVMSLSTSY